MLETDREWTGMEIRWRQKYEAIETKIEGQRETKSERAKEADRHWERKRMRWRGVGDESTGLCGCEVLPGGSSIHHNCFLIRANHHARTPHNSHTCAKTIPLPTQKKYYTHQWAPCFHTSSPSREKHIVYIQLWDDNSLHPDSRWRDQNDQSPDTKITTKALVTMPQQITSGGGRVKSLFWVVLIESIYCMTRRNTPLLASLI